MTSKTPDTPQLLSQGIFQDLPWSLYISDQMPDRSLVTAVVGLINHQGKLLTVKHAHRQLELPGGHLLLNESLRDGLKREVLEETGYHISEPIFCAYQIFYYEKPVKNYPFPEGVIAYALASTSDYDQFHQIQTEEIATVQSLAVADAIKQLPHDFQRQLVEYWAEHIRT